MINKLIKI